MAPSAAAAASMAAVRRLASTRTQVSSWSTHPGGISHGAPVSFRQSPDVSCDGNNHVSSASSSASSFSSSSGSSSAAAATAPQQPPQHQHHQAAAPVEVSPGDDDANGSSDSGRGRGRGRDHDSVGCGDGRAREGGGAYGVVMASRSRPPALGHQQPVSHHGSANRGRWDAERRLEHDEQEEEGEEERGPSSSYLLCGRPCPLATVEDLTDTALARAFFSGFLDSLEIILSLRLVSRRMMEVGSDACQVRCTV